MTIHPPQRRIISVLAGGCTKFTGKIDKCRTCGHMANRHYVYTKEGYGSCTSCEGLHKREITLEKKLEKM